MKQRIGDRLPRPGSRLAGIRVDHGLLAGGCALIVAGSFLPWIRGATRLNGNLSWTGFDDTGEGAMLLGGVVFLAVWMRWRRNWEELGSRARFAPLVIAIASALLWVIALRKALYLSWFELAVGARPQVGLLVAGLGVIVVLGAAVLVAKDREGVTGDLADREAQTGRSGAGGDGAASGGFRRGGGELPSPAGYSVVGRVDRLSGRAGGEGDDGPAGG